jgi:hypothetical protein
MGTVEKDYQVDLPRKKRYYRRSNMTKRKPRLPRKEPDCIRHVANFLNREKDKYKSKFKIIKETEEHFIPEIGKCVISDAVVYDVYKVKQNNKWVDKSRRVISIEFEEHWKEYSILNDVNRCPSIHVPLRKLHYYRPFHAQYWIKIDVDGTPICIPYRYIAKNSKLINDIGVQGQFTTKYQTNMIKAASRDENGKFPEYVIVGWRDIFKEFRRILVAYDTKSPVELTL